jgi:hypothetical protein
MFLPSLEDQKWKQDRLALQLLLQSFDFTTAFHSA